MPAVERAIEILELLADRPQELLGLSEIARTLTMNKASCHATLTLLAERGYLIRHAEKTYSLGPAILPPGQQLHARPSRALPHARAEMAAAGRDLNLACVASGIVDDEIVVLDQTSSPGSSRREHADRHPLRIGAPCGHGLSGLGESWYGSGWRVSAATPRPRTVSGTSTR